MLAIPTRVYPHVRGYLTCAGGMWSSLLVWHPEDCAPHLELSNRTRTVGLPQRQAGGIWMLGMGICNHESSGRHVTAHRSRALQHHWRGQLYESFLQDMYQVLKEVLSPDPTGVTGMGILSDCQLELKAWIRDVFTIAGERMTSH